MRRVAHILKRTVLAFYHDQGTQHAAAITYYSLMSLFPTALLGISLLGLIGQYPETYDAIMNYLREVAPKSVVEPIDASLRSALQNKGTAATGVVVSTIAALWGTTGVLEAQRRALNVVFRVQQGRSFLHRKGLDIMFTFVLLFLALATGVFIVVGQGFAEDVAGWLGFHSSLATLWDLIRWPAALMSAMLGFSLVYYVVPDIKHRGFHLLTPGAIVGVLIWITVSYLFVQYITDVANVSALYGAFAGAIIIVGWLWLSSCALLLGAELNHAIEEDRAQRRPRPDPPTQVTAPGEIPP